MSKQNKKIQNKFAKGFTLLELLVVVLIIGILSAIALPQYRKAVLKADLSRGIALVESLYKAQQVYYLTHGDYTTDLDDLDVSIPKDDSCTKTTLSTVSYYDCDYGRVYNTKNAVQFQNKPAKSEYANKKIAYTHQLKDSSGFKAGQRYCYAKPNYKIAQDVCNSIGEPFSSDSYWIHYEIK